MMRIGYACLTVNVPDTGFRTCTQKYATTEKLQEIIAHNLKSLSRIIDYNIHENIRLFRITSDLIPFGSSPVNTLCWQKIYREQFSEIAGKIRENSLRVSMHPGQYTILNAIRDDVVRRAVADLEYHLAVLEALKTGNDSKIILHIGGIYHNKEESITRFIANFQKLSERLKARIAIENDDRAYPIAEVLAIGRLLDIPVVYDNLHHAINPGNDSHDDRYWIEKCRETWKAGDGAQKIHYAEQHPMKHPGAHSDTINLEKFRTFLKTIEGVDVDIMLEVKDKNISAVKCNRILTL